MKSSCHLTKENERLVYGVAVKLPNAVSPQNKTLLTRNAQIDVSKPSRLSLPSVTLRWSVDAIGPIHVSARPRRRLSLIRSPILANVAPHKIFAEVCVAFPELTVSHLLLTHLAFSAHLLFSVEGCLLLLSRLLANAVCDPSIARERLREPGWFL